MVVPRSAARVLSWALVSSLAFVLAVPVGAVAGPGLIDSRYLLAAVGDATGTTTQDVAAAGEGGTPRSGSAEESDAEQPRLEEAALAEIGIAVGESLPVCRYRDVLTRYHERHEWRVTLLDTILRLRRSYAPNDLVPVSQAGIAGSGSVRRFVIADLSAMASAARAAGTPIAVRSAYRSYADQVATFNAWVDQQGYETALLYAARPGHSEHQLGTTLDFRSARSARAPWDYDDWGETPAGRWMARNAWRYGFIMSYPEGRRRQTCYGYEPWHYRYVGRPLAAAVHDSGLTLRRYLWETYETAP